MGPLRFTFPSMMAVEVVRFPKGQWIPFFVIRLSQGIAVELDSSKAPLYEVVQAGPVAIVIRLKDHPTDVIPACTTCGAPIV